MKLALIAFAALAAPTAFANDGGTPYINVDSVKVLKGGQIEVKGGDASKLYDVLPRNFVYDTSRALTITSKKKSVVISCMADAVDENAEMPVRDPKKTTCTITVDKAYDPTQDESDHSVWEPACKAEENFR